MLLNMVLNCYGVSLVFNLSGLFNALIFRMLSSIFNSSSLVTKVICFHQKLSVSIVGLNCKECCFQYVWGDMRCKEGIGLSPFGL